MAGAGVSINGIGMLRARRRDVSVKPNRKLDRKSSRGMIYENEELRLRTININAEVEQGQNDIKKLRKENEQLRHEIWSLRDEYDKLEEILKSQKSREGSEDYEDHSEVEEKDDDDGAEECSDYSDEEAEEGCNGKEKGCTEHYEKNPGNEANQEERLENAENQKISSEKMSSSNHRLHVEFDDLSVVDEEDELKKDKELRDIMSPDNKEGDKNAKEVDRAHGKPQNGYQFFSPSYGSPGASVFANSYYPDQSFVYRNADKAEFQEILPIDPSSMYRDQCTSLCNETYPSIANYEQLNVANIPSDYHDNFRRNQMTYGNQIGWQNDICLPNSGFQTSGNPETNVTAAKVSAMSPVLGFESPGQSNQSIGSMSTVRAGSLPRRANDGRIDPCGRNTEDVVNTAILPGVSQRRNFFTRQHNHYSENVIPNREGFAKIEVPASAEVLTCNGWDFDNAKIPSNANDCKVAKEENREGGKTRETPMGREGHQRHDHTSLPADDRPKHFFAPLPAKIQHARPESSDETSTGAANTMDGFCSGFLDNFGTGKSSSSDRSNSTIISARHFQHCSQLPSTLSDFFTDNGAKGAADVCVNGGVSANANDQADRRSNEERNCKSSENLFVEDKEKSRANSSSRHSSNNPLVKSVSCQDLSSEQVQNSLFEMSRSFQADGKCQKLAKSDNTLDNPVIGSAKPFRSQLNVTLKCPFNSGYKNGSTNRSEQKRYSPETPEIPSLPTIDYRLFNNPFLKTFDGRGGIYGNREIANPGTRPLAIQVNENSPERGKMLQWHQPPIDYSSAALTQSFAKRLNPDESVVQQARTYGSMNEIESDRHRISLSPATCRMPGTDPRMIGSPVKQRQGVQVTSFEAPNPRSLRPGLTAYDIDPMRIMSAPTTMHSPISNYPKLYQNVPFSPGAPGLFCSGSQNTMRMFYENQTQKVPAQTQTSVDDGSSRENDPAEEIRQSGKISDTENRSAPGSPNSTRRKRIVKKERVSLKTSNRSLSPAAQRRRLRKQSSVDEVDVPLGRSKTGNKTRQLSPAMTNTTTTTTSDHTEEKNESRSSSSGQDSPRKERNRKVSMYFNSKRRPSVESVRTRSFTVSNNRDNFSSRIGGDTVETVNSDRERTNSASSREAVARAKTRKSSISSGKLPWCSCWGNGCV